LGFADPLTAIVISFCFLGFMIYKRVNLGITLNAAALLLALLALDWQKIPTVIVETTTDMLTIAVVIATFGVMLLSELYKETKVINSLSESLSRIINNPKIVSSVLPAVIGFLPVAGGALMSAPLVDLEAEKLGLKPERKAYINLWFRHTIFPVYPVSQLLIITAALTETTIPSIIIRQIPVVIAMIVVGYIIGFWKTPRLKNEANSNRNININSEFKRFFVAFSPILTTILVVTYLNLTGLAKQGFDVLLATFIGLIILVIISKLNMQVFTKPLKNWGIYGITFAAYGAFLLRNVIKMAGVAEIFQPLIVNGTVNIIVLLIAIPAVLGFITGSPSGGITIGVSILTGILLFSPRTAALLYMSAYLGYLIAPTHLCFAFTAKYFKCSMGKMYKYIIPSFIISFLTALLTYFLF